MILLAALAIAACPAHGRRVTCVHDADSIVLEGERIRIANIDGAELDGKCPSERALALRGRDRLVTLLQPGFRVQRAGFDRYGRTLARITVEGRDVGAQLVAEGLARRWTGRRLSWC